MVKRVTEKDWRSLAKLAGITLSEAIHDPGFAVRRARHKLELEIETAKVAQDKLMRLAEIERRIERRKPW
jgi:hypothetical protein